MIQLLEDSLLQLEDRFTLCALYTTVAYFLTTN